MLCLDVVLNIQTILLTLQRTLSVSPSLLTLKRILGYFLVNDTTILKITNRARNIEHIRTSKQSSELVLFRAYLRACKILFCNTIHLQDFKEVCSNDQGISNKAERAFTWSFTSGCVFKAA